MHACMNVVAAVVALLYECWIAIRDAFAQVDHMPQGDMQLLRQASAPDTWLPSEPEPGTHHTVWLSA